MEKEIEIQLKKFINKKSRNKWQVKIKGLLALSKKRGEKQPFNDWGIATDNMPDTEKIKKAVAVLGQDFNKAEIAFLSRSKLGLLSYKLSLNSQSFRCLDCQKEELAEKIEAIIGELKTNGLDFIPLEKRFKETLFFKWIEGEQVSLKDFLRPGFFEEIANLQAKLHQCPLPSSLSRKYYLENSGYLRFLKNRLLYFANKYLPGDEEHFKIIEKAFFENRPNLKISITHPDLTDNNLILDKKGKVWLIDVESLSIDCSREYDILNTARFLFPQSKYFQSYYYGLYKKNNSLGSLETHRDFWERIWLLRLAGSSLQKGDIQEGERYLAILRENLKDNISYGKQKR